MGTMIIVFWIVFTIVVIALFISALVVKDTTYLFPTVIGIVVAISLGAMIVYIYLIAKLLVRMWGN
jgi:hypothetical protein